MSQRNRRSSILKPAVQKDDIAAEATKTRRVSFHTHRIVKEFEVNGSGEVDRTPQRERMQLSGQSDLSATLTDANLHDKENVQCVDVSICEYEESTLNKTADNTLAFVRSLERAETRQTSSSNKKHGKTKIVTSHDTTMMIFDDLQDSSNANLLASSGFDRTMAIFDSPARQPGYAHSNKVELDKTMALFDTNAMDASMSNASNLGSRTIEDLDASLFGQSQASADFEKPMNEEGAASSPHPTTEELSVPIPAKADDSFGMITPTKSEKTSVSTNSMAMDVSGRQNSSKIVPMLAEAREQVSTRENTSSNVSSRDDTVPMEDTVPPSPLFVPKQNLPVHMVLKAAVGKHSKPRPELTRDPSPDYTMDSTGSSCYKSPNRTLKFDTNEALNNKMRRISGALNEAKQNRRRSDVLKTAGKPDHTESPMEAAKKTYSAETNETYTVESRDVKTDASANASIGFMPFNTSDVVNLSRVEDPPKMFDVSFGTLNATNVTRLEDVATPVAMFSSFGTNVPENKSNSSGDSELSTSFSQRLSLGASGGQKTTESVSPLPLFDPDATSATSRHASLSTTKIRNIYEEFNLDEIDSFCEAVTSGNIDSAGMEASLVNSSLIHDMSKSMCATPMKKFQQRVSEPSFGLSTASDHDLTEDGASSTDERTYDVSVPGNGTPRVPVETDGSDKENGTYDVPVTSISAPVDESDGGTYTLSPNHSLLHQMNQSGNKLAATPSKPLSFASMDMANRSVAENLSNSIAFTTKTYPFSNYGFADRHLTPDESVRLAKFSDEVAGLQALAKPLSSRWPELTALADDIVPGLVIYECPEKFRDLNFLIEAAFFDTFVEAAAIPKEVREQVMLVRQKYQLAFEARATFIELFKSTYPFETFIQASMTYSVELLMAGKQEEFATYVESLSKLKNVDVKSDAEKLCEQRTREAHHEAIAEVAAFKAKTEELEKKKAELFAVISNL